MPSDPTLLDLSQLARAYRAGECTPTEATGAYLQRIAETKERFGPVYRVLTADRAMEQAGRAERAFEAGVDLGPLQGIPIALKDLMDTAGDVTAAGSLVLTSGAPAEHDCPAAARLDRAGAVFLGKTNMTELAFSGLGINPHFGTPPCIDDPGRVPGGSSSGSAVAVAARLAAAAVGSDTGGSVRIPSSFNGLVGLKTTDRRIPIEGCVPLSTTLDTLGPMARNSEDAWILLLGLLEEPYRPLPPAPEGATLLAPAAVLQERLDPAVAEVFFDACRRLEELGYRVVQQEVPELREITRLYDAYGSFANHEALALYQDLIEAQGAGMDPRVVTRILQFQQRPARDYLRLTYARERLRSGFWREYRDYAAVLAPTVAVLPPRLSDLVEEATYHRVNGMCLRNTMVFNFLGGPAATVPAGRSSEGLSIGLMIATPPGRDALALALAARFETSSEDDPAAPARG